MITHLLDTSVYSQRLRKDPVPTVVAKWSQLGNQRLAIPAACEAELLYGLEKQDSERMWTEYSEYLRDQIALLPFGYKEAGAYAHLRKSLVTAGQPVADMDLMIGATAIANGLILATLIVRHFDRMPGLRIEDWSG